MREIKIGTQAFEVKVRWRIFRERERLTQLKVAEAAGVSRSTAQRWDDVQTPYMPTVGQLAMICERHRINLQDALAFLFERNGRP